MGLFSRFKKKQPPTTSNTEQTHKARQRDGQPDVINVPNADETMHWAIQKAQLTLHYFESCLGRPKKGQAYFSIKVGIADQGKVEHIWLNDPTFDEDGNLFGTVGNVPMDVTTVKMGQQIGIDRGKVSDWMIIQDGRLIGGYTIRALREGYQGAAKEQFDRSLGGMIIDEGEDYLLASRDTPEGAIVAIEEAYHADDVEAALACKDFNIEARIMLAKMQQQENVALVSTTAEALRLSYLKWLQDHGMPKYDGVVRAFVNRQKKTDRHYVITEICTYPDGRRTLDRLNTYQTEAGWVVMGPEE